MDDKELSKEESENPRMTFRGFYNFHIGSSNNPCKLQLKSFGST